MKRKTGLQKKISSIFSGVAVPKSNAEDSSSTETKSPGKQNHPAEGSSSAVPVQNPFAHDPLPVQTPPPVNSQETSPRAPLISSSLGTKVDLTKPIVDLPDIPNEEEAPSKKVIASPVIYEPKLKSNTSPDSTETNESKAEDLVENQSGPESSPSHQPSSVVKDSAGRESKPGYTESPKPAPKPLGPPLSSMDPLEEALLQRQRKTKIMVGLLSVVFVAVMIWAFKPDLLQSTPEETAQSNASAVLTSLTGTPASIEWVTPEPYPADLRDPMVKAYDEPIVHVDPSPDTDPVPDVVIDETPDLPIKGIVYSEDRPSVIIGTDVYFLGDIVDGNTIVSITRNEVGFEKNEKRWSKKL